MVAVVAIMLWLAWRDRTTPRERALRERYTPHQRAIAAKLVLNASYGKGYQLARTRNVPINIAVVQFTERSFLAVCELGGMNIRGQRRDSALAAVQSLLTGLCGHDSSNADGVLGLDLAIEGTDLQELAQLGAGAVAAGQGSTGDDVAG